jgi:hypothetical protein
MLFPFGIAFALLYGEEKNVNGGKYPGTQLTHDDSCWKRTMNE